MKFRPFKKIRDTVKKVTSSKVGKFAAPLAVGAMPYLLAKGAVAATSRGGSVTDRARRFGFGAASGAGDYFRNPVVRAAGEVLPGVKPLARATERAAIAAQRNLDARRRGPIALKDVGRSAYELGTAAADAAGYSLPALPPGAQKAMRKAQKAAARIEKGSLSRADLRKVRAATKAVAKKTGRKAKRKAKRAMKKAQQRYVPPQALARAAVPQSAPVMPFGRGGGLRRPVGAGRGLARFPMGGGLPGVRRLGRW